MINRYTLGTVLGTALLGVAKSKLGSHSKLKLGYKQTIKGKLEFYLDDDIFEPLLDSKGIFYKIKVTTESYGTIVTDIDLEEIDYDVNGQMRIDNLLVVYINKSYYNEHPIEPEINNDFIEQFSTVLEHLESDLCSIIGVDIVSDIDSDIITWDTSRHPYIQKQSGEWVPYFAPTLPNSKLRKR